jgi:hypothetical protein
MKAVLPVAERQIVAEAKKACQQSDRCATEVSLHCRAFVILKPILADTVGIAKDKK